MVWTTVPSRLLQRISRERGRARRKYGLHSHLVLVVLLITPDFQLVRADLHFGIASHLIAKELFARHRHLGFVERNEAKRAVFDIEDEV